MSVFSSFRRPINYQQKSQAAAQGYSQLQAAQQRALDAEVEAAWRRYEEEQAEASDQQELEALGIQVAAAWLTQGQSLAYAPQINQLYFNAVGKPKAATTSKTGQLAGLASIGRGIYSANKANQLNSLDKMHEDNMALQENQYKALLASDPTGEQAALKANEMMQMERDYQQQRLQLNEGFDLPSWTGYGALTKTDPIKPEYTPSQYGVDFWEGEKSGMKTDGELSKGIMNTAPPQQGMNPANSVAPGNNVVQQNVQAKVSNRPTGPELNPGALGRNPHKTITTEGAQAPPSNLADSAKIQAQQQLQKNAEAIKANHSNLMQNADKQIEFGINQNDANSSDVHTQQMLAKLAKENPELMKTLKQLAQK